MCIKPKRLPPEVTKVGKPLDVACGHCWACRKAKVSDLVGRALCEAWVSDWTGSLTLTYRDSMERERDQAHRALHVSHIQLFMKQLRNRGHKVRYIAAGEYGEKKGRAHWHVLLFGLGAVPEWCRRKGKFVTLHEWPHGHVHVVPVADERHIRYACKYLLKGESIEKDGRRRWKWAETSVPYSKQPLLGAAYFERLAEYHASLDVLPHSFMYVPPGSLTGNPVPMTGATRRLYLDRWFAASGKTPDEVYPRLEEWTSQSVLKLERWRLKRAERDEGEQWEEFLLERRRSRVEFEDARQAMRRAEARLFQKRLADEEAFRLYEDSLPKLPSEHWRAWHGKKSE